MGTFDARVSTSRALFCAALAILGWKAAAADIGAGDTLEDIVVTAQKRSESIQDVPISVTDLPREELTRQGVQTISDLAGMSASLEFTAPSAGPGGGGFIRGIGTESLGGDTATSSVSVVLDGVVLGNTNITDIFDVDRVEILKGPQGTLFGTSVSAGVISITTNAPDPTKASSTVNAEYGSGDLGSQYTRRSLRATTNLPLTDQSAVRVSFHSDDNADVFHDTYTGQSSDDGDIGVRMRYLWNVNEDVKFNLIADYNKDAQNGVPRLTYRAAPAGSALAVSLAECGVSPSSENFDYCSQYNDRLIQLDRGVSGQIDWAIGGNTLTSISSYRLGDTDSRDDIEEIPLAIARTNFAVGTHCNFYDCVPIFSIMAGTATALDSAKRRQISEELRLASPQNQHLEWLVGLYYQHYKQNHDSPGYTTADFGGGEVTTDTFAYTRVHSEDYAAFGNATYHITDTTRLIAGARLTHSSVSEDKYDPSNTGTQSIYSLSASATQPTFRLGVQQNFASRTVAYLTLSTGYKAPEVADDLSNGHQLYAVSPERPQTAEIGVKQSAFDDRLAIDADIFYERVKDFQGQSCVPSVSQGIVCEPVNVPTVDSKGLEVDIFGRPSQGLTLNLSGIFNPATYPAHYLGSDGSDLGGRQLNFSSKTKVTFSLEQAIPMTAAYSFVVGTDGVYRSSQSMYLSSLPDYVAPAGTQWNVRLGLRSSTNWSVYAFGRNIGATVFPRQLPAPPFQTGGVWQALDASSRRVVGFQLEGKF